VRARVVIVVDGSVALIRRVRDGRTYHLFPGGRVEAGETAEQAAVREAHEELGVTVCLGPVVHRESFRGEEFVYVGAEITGGEFGTGAWPDHADPDSLRRSGTFEPVWVPLAELGGIGVGHDVRPRELVARLVARRP
jgi:8-oxo-dGTP pyrophosphatase MutT (NUDIX family)